MRYPFILPTMILLLTATAATVADTIKVEFQAPKGWRGETINLPPPFAKTMSIKGIEEIRFMPGMFDPKKEDFFSYALVFCLPDQKPLKPKQIITELLIYYRGLATSVSRGKKVKIDSTKFTLDLAFKKKIPNQYVGTLKWVEPFRTGKPQTLRIEIKAGKVPNINASYLSMAVSPQGKDHEVWPQLRKLLATAKYKKVKKTAK